LRRLSGDSIPIDIAKARLEVLDPQGSARAESWNGSRVILFNGLSFALPSYERQRGTAFGGVLSAKYELWFVLLRRINHAHTCLAK
jgi:hypothetical protein